MATVSNFPHAGAFHSQEAYAGSSVQLADGRIPTGKYEKVPPQMDYDYVVTENFNKN